MSNKVFFAFLVIAAVVVIGLVAWTGRKSALDPDTATNTVTTNTAANNPDATPNSNTTVVPTVNEVVVPVVTDAYTLLAEAETTVVGEITTYSFADNNFLNVMPAAMQSAVLNETPVKQRETITIGETAAERIIISSAKDGSDVAVVQAVIGETLYDFRGNEDFLSNLSQYIIFSN